ncbi:MAG: hypothetical protein ABI134_23370 [Byssovorax sp.]
MAELIHACTLARRPPLPRPPRPRAADGKITVPCPRTKRKSHIGVGQGAEADWVEMIPRLRGFITSRAKRTDIAQVAEARELLAPLTDALTRIDAEDARRATLRAQEAEKKKAEAARKPAAPDAPPADGAPKPV